ncbi:MAG: hypothetical protein M3N49_05785 [Candidatus Eremiobacteraeota bacterium]|nr:hypothetical protein [Candidatus Eremiobacteraeota bacterium]
MGRRRCDESSNRECGKDKVPTKNRPVNRDGLSAEIAMPRGYKQTGRKGGDPLRPIRALAIASKPGIKANGGGSFNVPSQSAPGANYAVEFQPDGDVWCSCPDWGSRKGKRLCKHGKAVVIVLEYNGKVWGDVVADEVLEPLPQAEVQKSDVEQLLLYNDAIRNPIQEPQFEPGTPQYRARIKKTARIMRDRLPRMLHALLDLEIVPPFRRPGRDGGRPPKLWLHQRAFCVLMRVFENRSLADTCYSLGIWAERDLIPSAPGINTLCEYMHDAELRDLFERLIHRIARTVRNIETTVVVDSSSFSTAWSANYLDADRGKRTYRGHNRWLKAHVGAGPITNVVSALYVSWNKYGDPSDKSNPVADVNYFLPLLTDSISRGWNVVAAAGDKGYFDDDHYRIPAEEMGIKVYIPFKKGAGKNKKTTVLSASTLEWLEFYEEFIDEFERVYNAMRPKIEGVFSATKRTTGPYLWSRGYTVSDEPSDVELFTIGTPAGTKSWRSSSSTACANW